MFGRNKTMFAVLLVLLAATVTGEVVIAGIISAQLECGSSPHLPAPCLFFLILSLFSIYPSKGVSWLCTDEYPNLGLDFLVTSIIF